ncbi:MAG: class I SAM-dependent methyltransferase [Actinomycetota bacterium]
MSPGLWVDPKLRAVAEAAKGFMPSDEGMALYESGVQAGARGPLLEIGTYCGKSAVYLGAAARVSGTVVFTVDHHRGSEEIQPGWEHHDPDLIDPATGRMDSLPFFRRTIAEAELEDVVIGIVGDSTTLAAHWHIPLGLVFIDGAHSEALAMADYDAWAPKIVPGGLLVVHDVYEDPADGGLGPFLAYERARSEGFIEHASTGSLRALRRG